MTLFILLMISRETRVMSLCHITFLPYCLWATGAMRKILSSSHFLSLFLLLLSYAAISILDGCVSICHEKSSSSSSSSRNSKSISWVLLLLKKEQETLLPSLRFLCILILSHSLYFSFPQSDSLVEGPVLNITRVRREHFSSYICHANNGVPPPASYQVNLEVSCKPNLSKYCMEKNYHSKYICICPCICVLGSLFL